MLAATLALVCIQGNMPTVDDVLGKCNKFLATVQKYSDEWHVEPESDGEKKELTFRRKLDGNRYSFSIGMEDKEMVEVADDGTDIVTVIHPSRQYMKAKDTGEARKPIEQPEVEENSFKFDIRDHGLVLKANPEFKTTQFEPETLEKKPYRHLQAEAIRSDGTGKLRLDLWLDPKEWVVCRFDVTKIKDGKSTVGLHATTKICDLAASFLNSDFQIPESKYAGYELVEGGLSGAGPVARVVQPASQAGWPRH